MLPTAWRKLYGHSPPCGAGVDRRALTRRRRIDEADNSTPVAIDQRAAYRRLYGHSPLCRAGFDRSALMSPPVIYCQCFEFFGARRYTASKLALLWNCSAAHELLLRDRKILLLEGR
ncbi:hypothetical protein TNCV_5020181 [Trichonephila clavipes]|nr:hypothetical protein TNCV_5020181 [Trichonephila clavipes]